VTEQSLDEVGSVLSQIGRTACGEGILFFLLQTATVGILVLAANTAYQDFPRLSAILAGDRLMPRQLRNQGDRLVFSNGVIILSLAAIGLIVLFDATLSRLIQLYVVGVFVSFTLSQASMVRRWYLSRDRGWRRSIAINAIGAATTGLVLAVVVAAKFTRGAWAVVLAIPLLVLTMSRVRRHYEWVAAQLSLINERRNVPTRTEVLVLVSGISGAALRGFEYARLIGGDMVQCIHIQEGPDDELWLDWQAPGLDIPLTVIRPRRRGIVKPLRAFIRDIRWEHPRTRVVVVVSELIPIRKWWWPVAHRNSTSIKAGLLTMRDVVVTNLVHTERPSKAGGERPPGTPTGRIVIIPVGGVTQATLDAVDYARWTRPSAIHAVHVTMDESYAERTTAEWTCYVSDIELTILPNPFRATTASVLEYIRRCREMAPSGVIVDVILPEFVVSTWLGRVLHNQTALALKAGLLQEPNVVVTSVPWHLHPETEAYSAREV